jgi:hypothetical protein
MPYNRGGQLDQFQEPHIRRQQSAKAMNVHDMNNRKWEICNNN